MKYLSFKTNFIKIWESWISDLHQPPTASKTKFYFLGLTFWGSTIVCYFTTDSHKSVSLLVQKVAIHKMGIIWFDLVEIWIFENFDTLLFLVCFFYRWVKGAKPKNDKKQVKMMKNMVKFRKKDCKIDCFFWGLKWWKTW